jgi:hypothetical protein
MDRSTPDCPAFSADEVRRLQRLVGADGTAPPLARRWLDADLGRLEQEAVDPESPLTG